MISIKINERIKVLRDKLNLSQREFSEKLSIGLSTLGMIEVSKREVLERHIKLICLSFNVNEEWLRNGTEPIFNENKQKKPLIDIIQEEYNLNPLSKKIIETYLSLPKEEQVMFENFAKRLFADKGKPNKAFTKEKTGIVNVDNIKKVKLYDTPVSAGIGSFMNEHEPYSILNVDTGLIPQARRCDFALRVRGDSMEPYYYDGDVVFVKEQPAIDSGQIGIFIYSEEAYIKKLYKENEKILLISLNEKYSPIEIKSDTFRCIGLVL